MDEHDQDLIDRIRYLMDGNGHEPLAVRLKTLEDGHERQRKAIERLETYAEASQRNTAELLGGWKVARWVLAVFVPAAIAFAWWIAGKLQAIA